MKANDKEKLRSEDNEVTASNTQPQNTNSTLSSEPPKTEDKAPATEAAAQVSAAAPPPRATHAKIVFPVIALAALFASIAGLTGYSAVCTAFRWIGCAALCYYGWRKKSLTTWIMISMVLGTEIGYSFSGLGAGLRLFSNIFLRMIKTIVAPLIFATLVVGIAGHSNLKEVGRLGVKSLVYFEVITTLALLIGVAAINITQAGAGIQRNDSVSVADMGIDQVQKPMTGVEIITHSFPENIAKSVAENQVLQIVVFTVIFAIALAQLPEEKRQPMITLCESLSAVMFKFTNIVMLFAPLGVGSAIAYTVGHMGLGVLVNLAKLVATLYMALFFFILVVLIPVMLICKINIIKFFKAVAEPMTLAFATTSSEAALPRAMEQMERFGVPRHIVAFVMPTGYSFNLDGSTLYLALATIFVAQAANVELTWAHQVAIVFMLMLTSKGVAGVPRATLIILLGAAASFNLPEWPILAILGVDELMDMARTATNVMGNCLASAVVARWEGQLGTGEDADAPSLEAIAPENV